MIQNRWLAIIPACILTWHAVVFLGLILLTMVDWFCPREEIVSGCCNAWWHPYAEQAIIVGSSGTSACLVVACAAVIAPGLRVLVSWLTYLVGLLIAYRMWCQIPDATAEFRAAAVGGLIVAGGITRIIGIRDLPILFEDSSQEPRVHTDDGTGAISKESS